MVSTVLKPALLPLLQEVWGADEDNPQMSPKTTSEDIGLTPFDNDREVLIIANGGRIASTLYH